MVPRRQVYLPSYLDSSADTYCYAVCPVTRLLLYTDRQTGACDEIRTRDQQRGKLRLYQTELHPEGAAYDSGEPRALQVLLFSQRCLQGVVRWLPVIMYRRIKSLDNVAVVPG